MPADNRNHCQAIIECEAQTEASFMFIPIGEGLMHYKKYERMGIEYLTDTE